MAKEKRVILCLFILVTFSYIIQGVLAEDTTNIIVKTLPNFNYSVTLNVLDPNSLDVLTGGTFENDTELSTGNAYFVYSSATRRIAFSVLARQNGRIVITKKFGVNNDSYPTGGSITLELFGSVTASSGASTSSNVNTTTVSNTTSTTPNITVNNSTSNISGNAILINQTSSASFFSKININWKKVMIYAAYVVGAVVIVFAIIFGFSFIKRKIGGIHFGGSSARSGGDIVLKGKEDKESRGYADKALLDAERKIKEAQATIDNIMNRKKRLADAERKFEESRRELEKLKKGY